MGILFSNAGVIGKSMNFKDTNIYFLGYKTLTYVGGKLQGGNGSTSDISISLTSLTGGTDSSPQAGDIVIIAAQLFNSSNLTYSLTNYTQITDLYTTASNVIINLHVGYKIMGSTPDTTAVIFKGTQTLSYPYAVAIHVWRNFDATTPIDVTPTTTTSNSSIYVDPSALTPTTSGAKIIIAGAGSGYATSPNGYYTTSYLSDFISQGYVQSTYYSSIIGMGDIPWTSGSYDPAAWSFSNSTLTYKAYAAVTFALRPESIYGNYQNSGIWNINSTNY